MINFFDSHPDGLLALFVIIGMIRTWFMEESIFDVIMALFIYGLIGFVIISLVYFFLGTKVTLILIGLYIIGDIFDVIKKRNDPYAW